MKWNRKLQTAPDMDCPDVLHCGFNTFRVSSWPHFTLQEKRLIYELGQLKIIAYGNLSYVKLYFSKGTLY